MKCLGNQFDLVTISRECDFVGVEILFISFQFLQQAPTKIFYSINVKESLSIYKLKYRIDKTDYSLMETFNYNIRNNLQEEKANWFLDQVSYQSIVI